MTQLIIPNFADALFDRPQAQAAIHGRTAAEEAQALLTSALAQPPEKLLKHPASTERVLRAVPCGERVA